MEESDPIITLLEAKPVEERRKLRRLLLGLEGKRYLQDWEALDLVEAILRAGEETRQARARERRTDARRRCLVGARVPRAFYERCKREASLQGLSLYAWVVEALERALVAPW